MSTNLAASPEAAKFAQLMINTLYQAGEQRAIQYDPASFRIVARDSASSTEMFLASAMLRYGQVDEASRERIISQYARAWFAYRGQVPQEYGDAHMDLYPKVHVRGHTELLELHMRVRGQGDLHALSVPFGDALELGFVYDLGQAYQDIQEHHLGEWSQTPYEIYEQARRNIGEYLSTRWRMPQHGFYISSDGTQLEAGRLLFPELLSQLAVDGDTVVMAPHTNFVLVTGTDDQQGLDRMADIAEQVFMQPGRLLPVPLVGSDDGWCRWFPPQEFSCYQRFRSLHLRRQVLDYQVQTALMSQDHIQRSINLVVEPYRLYVTENCPEPMSRCVWSEKTAGLLPHTDQVVFVRECEAPESPRLTVPWDAVVDSIGDLIEPQSVYPLRYAVKGFPNAQQWAALEKASGAVHLSLAIR